jgi:hypothetical protein
MDERSGAGGVEKEAEGREDGRRAFPQRSEDTPFSPATVLPPHAPAETA